MSFSFSSPLSLFLTHIPHHSSKFSHSLLLHALLSAQCNRTFWSLLRTTTATGFSQHGQFEPCRCISKEINAIALLNFQRLVARFAECHRSATRHFSFHQENFSPWSLPSTDLCRRLFRWTFLRNFVPSIRRSIRQLIWIVSLLSVLCVFLDVS